MPAPWCRVLDMEFARDTSLVPSLPYHNKVKMYSADTPINIEQLMWLYVLAELDNNPTSIPSIPVELDYRA